MVKVLHKNPSFSGRRCGVLFDRGKALIEGELTDAQRFHFERWGCTIERDAPQAKPTKGKGGKSTKGSNDSQEDNDE